MGRFAPELYGDFVQHPEMEDRLNRFSTEVVDAKIASAIEGSSGGAVISVPLISGPTTARDGTTIALTASATSLLVGGSIVSFTWTLPDGSTQTTPATNGSASINVAASGTVGETKTVSVKATDNAANQSQSAAHVFAISDNGAPDVTNLTTNIPASIRVGETLTGRLIAGATDPDGDTVTYTLFLPTGLTASKTAGINNNEPFSLTAAPDMTVGANVTITIAARDGRGGEAQKLISLAIAAAVVPSGEAVFTTPGTYNWVVPAGVTSVSAVCIGGGSGGRFTMNGGGLGWKNNIPVTPGSTIQVIVGAGGNSASTAGKASSFGTLSATGGNNVESGNPGAAGGTFANADGGGSGGIAGTNGGGGAAGYSGNGGNGWGFGYGIGSDGAGGGGGGGGITSGINACGGGGGVGLYGVGANGSGGGSLGGGGGSGGSDANGINGGLYGGGGGYVAGSPGAMGTGGGGAVRIIWGENRSFPFNAA